MASAMLILYVSSWAMCSLGPTLLGSIHADPNIAQNAAPTLKQLAMSFNSARATYLAPAAPDPSSSSLFGTKEGGEALIKVLEVTKACFRHHEHVFDPG